MKLILSKLISNHYRSLIEKFRKFFLFFSLICFIVQLYYLRIWVSFINLFLKLGFFYIRLELFGLSKSTLTRRKFYQSTQTMINYFLQEQPDISPEVKQLVQTKLSKPRKYQPFHIDCQFTKKKICYCLNNPVLNVEIDPKIKENIWKKYQDADDFFMGIKEEDKIAARKQMEIVKTKIQSLGRSQVINFVRSIKKEKNLIGEMIEY